jgi:hypothetical protein
MNPKQLNDYNNKKKYRKDMFCQRCNKIFKNTNATSCLLCGKKLIVYNSNIPKCPTCQSTNIKKISTVKRATHGAIFGVFSNTARSQFECQNCKYKW